MAQDSSVVIDKILARESKSCPEQIISTTNSELQRTAGEKATAGTLVQATSGAGSMLAVPPICTSSLSTVSWQIATVSGAQHCDLE